jgi:hypothetical protein
VPESNSEDPTEVAESDGFEDLIVEEESIAISTVVDKSKTPLLDIEVAREEIGTAILDVLEVKFKGSLTQVRYPDENDRLF